MKANPSRQNPDLPFILGAQYYRAPTPEPSDWEHDFAQMAESGFNTVKLWAQWRWNNPAEGVYDFSDLEKMLELAERYGLKVIINTILDVAPAWVFERWPESRLLTLDGRVLGPAALQHRQIGGAPGCCFHHTASAECAYEFLARCAEALKSSPALLAWDAWNEPELTCALARAPKLENLVCYCPASLQAFKEWLRKRYGDSLEALNTAWGRNYADWQEVEVPRSFGTFRDMLDWRRFFLDTLTAELRRRVQVLKARDPAHPVMAHTVPFPIFNLATCASDDFELAAECDFFGNSAGSSAMAADLLQSAARDKLVLNAEVHALPGSTFYQFQPLQPKDVDSFLLAPLAQNIKGFLFWQYRPERLGWKRPTGVSPTLRAIRLPG
jgi:beta-galactosidase